MNILRKIFDKRGIKDVAELDKEEREVFENYEKILSKESLTIEDLQKFCEAQVGIIESRWKDYAIEASKKAELIPSHTVYKTLSQLIKSPMIEREQLEKYLIQLHNL